MTRRQLSALFQETLVSEPPIRDLVGPAIERARIERRRVVLITTLGVTAAAVLALVVLPTHGPWHETMSLTPADLPVATLPDRFLPVPGVGEGATPRDGSIAIAEPWAAVHVDDPYAGSQDPAGLAGVGWTGTSFAAAVRPLLDIPRAVRSGLQLGFDGPQVGALDGTVPSRWVETWVADKAGVTGVWVQQWALWPKVWQYCTTMDDTCMSSRFGAVTVVSYPTRISDPVTHKPVSSWIARASTEKNLMIVVVSGPRTRAGVSAGGSRTQPLFGRVATEQLALKVAQLGY